MKEKKVGTEREREREREREETGDRRRSLRSEYLPKRNVQRRARLADNTVYTGSHIESLVRWRERTDCNHPVVLLSI